MPFLGCAISVVYSEYLIFLLFLRIRLLLLMQSVSITTNVASFEYHPWLGVLDTKYVTKVASDLRQVCGFPRLL